MAWRFMYLPEGINTWTIDINVGLLRFRMLSHVAAFLLTKTDSSMQEEVGTSCHDATSYKAFEKEEGETNIYYLPAYEMGCDLTFGSQPSVLNGKQSCNNLNVAWKRAGVAMYSNRFAALRLHSLFQSMIMHCMGAAGASIATQLVDKGLSKLKKALYGLKHASRAWYNLLSSFLLSQNFSKGIVDPTLLIRREGKDILLVQIYVDDIILASSKPDLCETFSEIMCLKFKMSMMGKLSFFLGLQISQSPRSIFLNQSKFDLEIIKKYGMETSDPVDTPMVEKSKLDADSQGKEVDPTRYRGMIGSLMYLTANPPDLQFVVCMCARYQAKPTEKHIHVVKRIIRDTKSNINMGLVVFTGFLYCPKPLLPSNHCVCQSPERKLPLGRLAAIG
ncbi:retrovirus-related pol polyprotein from transposon TNT 1-94 [Tanacetum coccineum]